MIIVLSKTVVENTYCHYKIKLGALLENSGGTKCLVMILLAQTKKVVYLISIISLVLSDLRKLDTFSRSPVRTSAKVWLLRRIGVDVCCIFYGCVVEGHDGGDTFSSYRSRGGVGLCQVLL